MGWAIGYDDNWERDIGYGVPALCDYPDCSTEINRGLAYVCADQQPYGGENGCGLFFCSKHAEPGTHQCARCQAEQDPFEAKPDILLWVRWKLVHESWEEWRKESPDQVLRLEWTWAHAPPSEQAVIDKRISEEIST